jgi:uncharacterized BrkB/YihY/UPF0761 family membrane protein
LAISTARISSATKNDAYLADDVSQRRCIWWWRRSTKITKGRGTGKLSLGILLALWAASSGVSALAQALNSAYDVTETRPGGSASDVVAMTVALSILIVSALILVLYGGQFGEALANQD